MHNIPRETLHEILSYFMPGLSDPDLDSLKACALACRALAAIAQPLFFQIVTLKLPRDIPALLSLTTVNPVIASWIRTLLLRPHEDMREYLQRIASPEAHALFSQLRAVQKLHLDFVQFHWPESDITVGNLKLLSGVSELVLNYIWFDSPAQALGLMAQYSALSSLQMHSHYFDASSCDHGSMPADAFRHVKHLSIGVPKASSGQTLASLQLLELTAPHLARSVELDLRAVFSPFACQKIIDMIAPSGLAFTIRHDDGIDALNLREASRLERLTVVVSCQGIFSLCRSLATINRPEHLQSLELFFDGSESNTDVDESISDEPSLHKPWQELDAVLSRLTGTKNHPIALRLHASPNCNWDHLGSSQSLNINFADVLPSTFQCSRFDISCVGG
jgi:hypothetical protein